MRDLDLRKTYPNVNFFEEIAIKASWSATDMNSRDSCVYQFQHKRELYKVTVEKILEE